MGRAACIPFSRQGNELWGCCTKTGGWGRRGGAEHPWPRRPLTGLGAPAQSSGWNVSGDWKGKLPRSHEDSCVSGEAERRRLSAGPTRDLQRGGLLVGLALFLENVQQRPDDASLGGWGGDSAPLARWLLKSFPTLRSMILEWCEGGLGMGHLSKSTQTLWFQGPCKEASHPV